MIKALLSMALLAMSQLCFASGISIYTASGPGSLADTAARFFAPLIEKESGSPVSVFNHPGGNGVVGISAFLKSKGSSIFIGSTVQGYLKMTSKTPFDPIRDLTPLYGLSITKQQVLVPASSPFRSISDMGGIKLNGGAAHPSTEMSMLLLDHKRNGETVIVGYSQTSQVAIDLAAGRIDYTIGGVGNSATQGFIDSGRIRSLGELPVEGFSWLGWFGRSGDLTNGHLRSVLQAVMNSPEAAAFAISGRGLLLLDGPQVAKYQSLEMDAIRAVAQGK